MRILGLSLNNLNSLAGSWSVDFTAPEYAASGIFAITGPTGAGKSTLLDALCLALYGRTPRLGPITKGSNEIMSRRAGECFAEVSFTTLTGSYRCHWGQHRARRKAEGELQTPRHELVELETGKILESRSRQVVRLVEELTGMDYDRFTRSILLAQGDFAAFLQADADQRAPILEQITGTSIYSQLSIAVHERTSEERKHLKSLQDSLGALQLLSPEEITAITNSIKEQSTKAEEVRSKLTLVEKQLQLQEQLANHLHQLKENENRRSQLAQEREARAPELTQLAQGLKAQPLVPLHTSLNQLSSQISNLEKRREQRALLAERLEQTLKNQQVKQQQAQKALVTLREEREAELELIKEVRALDLHLFENQKNSRQLLTTIQQHNRELAELSVTQATLLKKQSSLVGEQQALDRFCKEHLSDEQLVEEFAGLRQQLLHLAQSEEGHKQDAQKLRTLEKELQAAHTLHEASTKRAAQIDTEVQHCLEEQQQRKQERDALLEGQPLGRLRDQLAALDALTLRLQQGRERAKEWQALQKKVQEQEEQTTALSQQSQELQLQLCQKEEELQLRKALVLQHEKNHQLQLRIRSYEQERDHLQEGTPCPLCGSSHHPWGRGEVPQEDFESELQQARKVFEESQKQLASLREKLALNGRDLEHLKKSGEETQARLRACAAQLTPLLAAHDLGPINDCDETIEQQLNASLQQQSHLRTQIQKVEEVESRLVAITARLEKATTLQKDANQRLQASQQQRTAKDHEVQTHTSHLKEAERNQLQAKEELKMALLPYQDIDLDKYRAERLITELESRRTRWKNQLTLREKLTQQENQLKGELEKQALQVGQLQAQIQLHQERQQLLAQERKVLGDKRQELYSDKDPNLEEQRLRQRVEATEKKAEENRLQLVTTEKELHGLRQQQHQDNEELQNLLPQKDEQEATLLSQLETAGFSDLNGFRAAILPLETLQQLEQRKQQLEQKEGLLIARNKELEVAIEKTRGQVTTASDHEGLNQEKQQLVENLEELQQAMGAAQERLRANEQQAQAHKQQQAALEKQRQEVERFEVLHQLIGSADGKKFRVFAQGLTFEVMVSHANRQLQKMSDRYILLRDPERPLSLQVIDNYQAGEVRSTRNLSGGESFLVSLALSLGLSAMASHNVRVDSLFLDEGFGTLDEETLDTALQTLSSLHQDGKLIGIISHVSLLQERIDLRIQVQPGVDGCSRLIGPGCRQLA